MTLLFVVSQARATPLLQLYVEGGTYDTTTQTWVVDTTSSTLRLWAIGNVDGPGGKGTISNVRLAIAYASDAAPVSITLTPSTTNPSTNGGFYDPSTPIAPTLIQTVTDGSRPKLSDGSDLPGHGIYGTGTYWQEFALGDFSLKDSPIADFVNAFPTLGTSPPAEGQINVYEIQASASGPVSLHFDLYDSIMSGNKARAIFAPFSHDAEGDGGPDFGPAVPEPSTLALAIGCIAPLAAIGVIRRRRQARADGA